jgi:HSP20 family protein
MPLRQFSSIGKTLDKGRTNTKKMIYKTALPVRNIAQLFLEDGFGHRFSVPKTTPHRGHLPVNVEENAESVILHIQAPGRKKSDFAIEIEEHRLLVSAETDTEKQEENRQWIRKEFEVSAFKRSFKLNDRIDAQHIAAAYTDGVLTITLPKKKEDVQPSKVQIAIK